MKPVLASLLFATTVAASCGNGQPPQHGNGGTLRITERTNEPVDLPVRILPTQIGSPDDTFTVGMQYPPVIATRPDSMNNYIAAYGAAHEVWIGPKGWDGSGATGANGNIVVRLYPANDTLGSGAQIIYHEVPGCQSCILEAASAYFPAALQRYRLKYGAMPPGLSIPAGLTVNKLSPELLTYTLSRRDGLLTIGVASYTAADSVTDAYFIDARFVLPEAQHDLADFLVRKFIEMRKLR